MANEEKLPVAKEKELWLMGFRILVAEEEEEDGSMRKSWSMGNLSTTAPVGLLEDSNRDCGYLSEGNLDRPARKNRRKRGIPWTVEEHKTFLQGLEKLGKGDWRGISKNFVTTRTPTQVASHAQKYFLRQMNPHKRKRRSSLFDVAIDNKDKSSAANPAFTFRNAREMEEENKFPVHDNTTPIVQVPISTQASFSSHEASPSSERMTGSHAFLNHYHVNSKVESNDATNDKVISFQSKFLPDPSPSQAETSIIRSGSATCTLDFLELSINTTQLKTQEIETPFIQCSDLELHIGLPQPHLTTKVPFPNMQGTVRVI